MVRINGHSCRSSDRIRKLARNEKALQGSEGAGIPSLRRQRHQGVRSMVGVVCKLHRRHGADAAALDAIVAELLDIADVEHSSLRMSAEEHAGCVRRVDAEFGLGRSQV